MYTTVQYQLIKRYFKLVSQKKDLKPVKEHILAITKLLVLPVYMASGDLEHQAAY